MAHYPLDHLQHLDAKTRRRLEDQRRMRYRRAIEDYWERRRLNAQLAELPGLQEIA